MCAPLLAGDAADCRSALKWSYAADQEHRSLSKTRSGACEIVAWRLLAHFSEREAMDYCLYEIPDDRGDDEAHGSPSRRPQHPRPEDQEAAEASPLLPRVHASDETSRIRPAAKGQGWKPPSPF